MSRQMTPTEKQRFRGYFPGLDVDRAVVTDETTKAYNCISWTVGVTDRWLWPGSSIQNFDAFDRNFGYVRTGSGPIAAWGHSTANMTHGSISGSGHGPRWESKCGSDLRIQHGLNELAGSSYGRVLAFYARGLALDDLAGKILKENMEEMDKVSIITVAEKEALDKIIADIPSETKKTFSKAFEAWKKTWFEGSLSISSDPHTRTIGKEFDTLIAMGPTILPLLVDALAEPDNFLALQLYDVLQSDDKLIVQYGPEDGRILEGEQGRARRVVKTWLANR